MFKGEKVNQILGNGIGNHVHNAFKLKNAEIFGPAQNLLLIEPENLDKFLLVHFSRLGQWFPLKY